MRGRTDGRTDRRIKSFIQLRSVGRRLLYYKSPLSGKYHACGQFRAEIDEIDGI